MISFKANPIYYTRIAKLENNSTKPKPYKVSLVELDYENLNDIKSLKETSELWDNNETFAFKIYQKFSECYYKYQREQKYRVLALTQQSKNFNQLSPTQILGLLMIDIRNSLENNIYVDFLQTHPEHKTFSQTRTFNGIGRRLMEYIIEKYKNKNINLFPSDNSSDFYQKLGFVKNGLKMIKKV